MKRLIELIEKNKLDNYTFLKEKNKILTIRQYKAASKLKTFTGRILLYRNFGKLIFFSCKFENKIFQIVATKDKTKDFDFLKYIDRGDNIIFYLKDTIINKKNLILDCIFEWKLVSKCFFDLPQQYFGLKNIQLKYNNRYLDLITNSNEFLLFTKINEISFDIEIFLKKKQFLKIITPTLEKEYGGANATPFETILNCTKNKFFLSVAPEFNLKKYLIAGFSKVYALTKCFRNEGVDTSHHPEFLSLEIYQAQSDCKKMSKLVETITKLVYKKFDNTKKIKFKYLKYETAVNKYFLSNYFTSWKKIKYKYLIEILQKKGDYTAFINKYSAPNVKNEFFLMFLFQNYVENYLIDPVHITDYPLISTSLCEENESKKLDRIESYIDGKEIANMYTEEINFLKLEENMYKFANVQEESEPYNVSFLKAMAYGMPRAGGLGIGLQRLIMLAAKKESIKDIIFEPLSN